LEGFAVKGKQLFNFLKIIGVFASVIKIWCVTSLHLNKITFMKYYQWLFLIVFFNSMVVFSQEKYKQHTVSKGETISEIAQKYNVKPSAIYELNPDAVNGIKLKSVLLIPIKATKNTTVASLAIANNLPEKTHEVQPKETLYGITKQYLTTVEDLYKINPNLEKDGLKIGQTIKIPMTVLGHVDAPKEKPKSANVEKINVSKKNIAKEEIVLALKTGKKLEIPTPEIEHEVLPKESLYSIAKKYGIKLADLQKANPELANKSLKVGQKITVPVKADANATLVAEKSANSEKYQKAETKQTPALQEQMVENKKLEAEKTIPALAQISADAQKSSDLFTHEVLKGESLYLIAKKYNITLSDLRKSNAELGNKSLKVGQKILVPVKASLNSSLVAEKTLEEKEVKTDKALSIVPKDDDEVKNSEIEITHQVLPKETKYGIAKKYGISVAVLEKQNPNISKKLLVGSQLIIHSTKPLEKELGSENIMATKDVFVTEKIENQETNNVFGPDFVDQLIQKASENIGTRYRSGGTTKEGFDCSGLMYYTFSNYNIKLPRSSFEMAAYGTKIDAQDARKGDLIFFRTRGSGQINHVGMVVEVLEGELKFIHSATRGGVIISSSKESYYERNFAQVNRVL
jgi:LysM repeat protein